MNLIERTQVANLFGKPEDEVLKEFRKTFTDADRAEINALIDPCPFRAVLAHLFDPTSEIDAVWFLKTEKIDLAEMGAFFIKSKETEATFWGLVLLGLIEMGNPVRKQQYFGKYLVNYRAYREVQPSRKCYVIHAPPFYLVRETKTMWR